MSCEYKRRTPTRGHLGPSPDDPKVHEPLSPGLIERMGLDNPLPDPSGFSPDGAWTMRYRVWGTHGHFRCQNKNMGHVQIQKRLTPGGAVFEVEQEIVNADAMAQRIHATVTCRNDTLAAPRQWSFRSQCFDSAFCLISGLGLEASGRMEDGVLHETVGGRTRSKAMPGPLAVNWLIMDIIQRDVSPPAQFTVFEQLLKLKVAHCLQRSALPDQQTAKSDGPLTCFVQIGSGSLPVEYWRDRHSRVVAFFSGSVAHFLDDEALTKTDQLKEELLVGGVHYEY